MKTPADPVLSSVEQPDDEISRFLDNLTTPSPTDLKAEPAWPATFSPGPQNSGNVAAASSQFSSTKKVAAKTAAPAPKLFLKMSANAATKVKQFADSTSSTPENKVQIRQLRLTKEEQTDILSLLGDTDDMDSIRQSECISRRSGSKQAVYARQYRQKNKHHVDQLTQKVEDLRTENQYLSEENGDLKETVSDLKSEVEYLRSVIANDSQISSLIQGIQNIPGTKLRFECAGGKRKTKRGPRGPAAKRAREDEAEQPGVCLHVRSNEVSVEFCGRCNRESRCNRIKMPTDVLRNFKFHHRNIEM